MKVSARIPERTLLHADLHSVPADWRIEYLGNIATTQYGLSTQTSNDGETPIIGMQDIVDGYVRLSQTACVSLREEEIEKYALHERDILFNRTNSRALVGKTGIVDLSPASAIVFASYLVRIRADEAEVDARFLNYFMNSFSSQKQLSALATLGVSQANINPSDLRSRLLIPIPPLEEQRGIADVLRVWDRGIREVESAIRMKIELKRGLAQQLLAGKQRFPEFIGSTDFSEIRYGLLPSDWRYVEIGEVARQVTARRGDQIGPPVLSCTKRKGLVDSAEYFDRQVHSRDTSNYKVVERGQFAYATNHIEEGSIGLLTHRDAGLVSPMYTVFEVSDKILAPFLFAVLKTETYMHIFRVRTSSSVNRRGSLRWSEFSRIHVPVPSLPEQERIIKILGAVDHEIELLRFKLGLLRRQKRGLMQKLLTGEVRIPAGGE